MTRDVSLYGTTVVSETFLGMPNKLRGLGSRNVFVGGTERRENQAAGSSSKPYWVRKRYNSRQSTVFNS